MSPTFVIFRFSDYLSKLESRAQHAVRDAAVVLAVVSQQPHEALAAARLEAVVVLNCKEE